MRTQNWYIIIIALSICLLPIVYSLGYEQMIETQLLPFGDYDIGMDFSDNNISNSSIGFYTLLGTETTVGDPQGGGGSPIGGSDPSTSTTSTSTTTQPGTTSTTLENTVQNNTTDIKKILTWVIVAGIIYLITNG